MQTIFLEFQHASGGLAAGGTDTIFYIDGRWSALTTRLKIEERVQELRSGPDARRYSTRLFVGYTHSQHPFHSGKGGAIQSMTDPNPPEWKIAQDEAKAKEESDRRAGIQTL